MDEADLPTKCAKACEDPRVPQADVDEGRPGRDPVAPGEGAAPAVGVTTRPEVALPRHHAVGPVRSRTTFAALRRASRRGRSGPLSVAFVEQTSWSERQIAYALNRRVGNAVVRNRLRRRLRAIMLEVAPDLPTGAYVVQAGPAAPTLKFNELKVAMSQALERAVRQTAPSASRSSTGVTR
jgi:ribonuclease P protein component